MSTKNLGPDNEERRALLTALPIAGVALALPNLAVAAEPEDPVLAVFREWVAARQEGWRCMDLPGNGNLDRPESVAAQQREDAAFWRLLEMTPTSLAGIAALATLLWDLEGPHVIEAHPDFAEMCEQPSRKLIRAIYRAASGKDALPPSEGMEGVVA